tara:strand:+ start:162 stop:413 length:252 start_codon:yes stop_codon:yes gene_type:complete
MKNKRDVWDYRDGLEDKLISRLSSIEAHMENVYHHVKRIDSLLEKQNGRVRKNELIINKWKGIAFGVFIASTAISSLIGIMIG